MSLVSSVAKSAQVEIVIQNSAYGSSLVATKDYWKGDLILPLTGRRTARSYRTIEFGPVTHREDEVLAYLVHSCRPNAVVNTDELTLRAGAHVPAGIELTFFYPSTEWELARPFNCLCGAPECIHLVAGAKYLAIETRSHHFVNRHIRELAMAALLNNVAI